MRGLNVEDLELLDFESAKRNRDKVPAINGIPVKEEMEESAQTMLHEPGNIVFILVMVKTLSLAWGNTVLPPWKMPVEPCMMCPSSACGP